MRKILLRKNKGPLQTVAKLFIDDEDHEKCVIIRLMTGKKAEITRALPGNDLHDHVERIAANFPTISESDFREFVKRHPMAKLKEFDIEGWEAATKEVPSEQA